MSKERIICEGLSLSISPNSVGSSGLQWMWYEPHHDIHPPSFSLSPLPPSPPCVTSSAAPSLPGLPFWDGEGEQRWGLHEKELPGDARLHETLQPAHDPRRCTYVKVRHKHIHARNVHVYKDLIYTQMQSRTKQSSHVYICYLVVVCILCTYFSCALRITILSADKSKHGRFTDIIGNCHTEPTIYLGISYRLILNFKMNSTELM